MLDGEQYSKDIAILWAAYKAGSFPLPAKLSQSDFIKEVETTLSQHTNTWIVDDDSGVFSSKRGPVAMVSAVSTGLIVEPRFIFFKWATPRTRLRSTVSFLNMIRHSKKTGIIVVRVTKENVKMPTHMKAYDLLYFVGKSAENEYLYSLRGRGSDN